MSAPFQAGDVVVCVDLSPNRFGNAPKSLKVGQVSRVTAVAHGKSGWFIVIPGCRLTPGTHGYLAWRFRKITAADEQFTAKIKALRPAQVRA